jgi:hypothetical protein
MDMQHGMDLEMQHRHGLAVWICLRCFETDTQYGLDMQHGHGHGHAAWTSLAELPRSSPCYNSMSMLYVHVHAASLRPYCMLMLCVQNMLRVGLFGYLREFSEISLSCILFSAISPKFRRNKYLFRHFVSGVTLGEGSEDSEGGESDGAGESGEGGEGG